MKKILILCLTIILVASFTACGKNEVLATIDGNKIDNLEVIELEKL